MVATSLAALLEGMGTLLEIQGENPFKTRAYFNAAQIVSSLTNIEELVKNRQLRSIKGIGEALAAKIDEYVTTGRIRSFEELTAEIPLSVLELTRIPGLGPKKIKTLFERLGITSMGELEYACRENRLITLPGFGAATQEKILQGIEFVKRHHGEHLLSEVLPVAIAIRTSLASLAGIEWTVLCGSIRRHKEVIGDIDILVGTEDPLGIRTHFSSLPVASEVLCAGVTKTSVRLTSGIEADLRVVTKAAFPFALLYFTGSKDHNVRLRARAKDLGLRLNEYGLFRDNEPVVCTTETEIYEGLGLTFIEPELREDLGEIDMALAGNRVELVTLSDIRGTFHIHTDFSDGSDSVATMVTAAKRLGLTYIGISDHSRSASYAGGLKPDDVLRQWEIIDRLNERDNTFHVFKGIESDILPDGSLDYDEDILKGFDFVIASVHSHFSMKGTDMEARIIRALENPYTTMLGHPTGRLLLARDGFNIDMKTIIDTAEQTGTLIELNASPYRLDIDWRHCIYARDKHVMISINPDAHNAAGLADIGYGIGIARKGWLGPNNILNTRDVNDIKVTFAHIRNGKRHSGDH